MADYYTQFSCLLDVGSADNVARALDIYRELEEALERDEDAVIGFLAAANEGGSTALWLRDDSGHGDPEHVIAFVLRCAEALGLTGRWGFTWALTCSRPRLEGFGGGAQVIDLGRRESLAWTDCDHWLAVQLVAEAIPIAPGA